MANVLVLIADGSEEMEAVIVIDVLRRAGFEVTVAATGTTTRIEASRGILLTADKLLADIQWSESFDLLVLPGGKGGAETFTHDSTVQQLIRAFDQDGKWIAAICAAPMALDAAGILRGRKYTCYPGVEQALSSGQHTPDTVVQDENLITSRGPGTTFAFALHLVALLENKKTADTLRRQLLLDA